MIRRIDWWLPEAWVGEMGEVGYKFVKKPRAISLITKVAVPSQEFTMVNANQLCSLNI